MYVCVCSAVTDKQIEGAVADGAACVDDLAMQLGVGACCGLCREEAQAVIARAITRPVCFVGVVPKKTEAVLRDEPRA